MLASCDLSNKSTFPLDTGWNFIFINHARDDPYFKPTIYGIEDACAALRCTYEWQGSKNKNAVEMAEIFRAAIDQKPAGIAVSLIDDDVLNPRVDDALKNGIPVIAYNADNTDNAKKYRLAYIGQKLEASGEVVGKEITRLVHEGPILGFIQTRKDLNTRPRMDGVKKAIQEGGWMVTDGTDSQIFTKVATGSQTFVEVVTDDIKLDDPFSVISYYAQEFPQIKGMIAVDGSSTEALARVMKEYKPGRSIYAGGYDLLKGTREGIHDGFFDFSIDQRPYMQGFLSVIQLFLYRLSGGQLYPFDIDTGMHLVDGKNINPYRVTSRFNGESQDQQTIAFSRTIPVLIPKPSPA